MLISTKNSLQIHREIYFYIHQALNIHHHTKNGEHVIKVVDSFGHENRFIKKLKSVIQHASVELETIRFFSVFSFLLHTSSVI